MKRRHVTGLAWVVVFAVTACGEADPGSPAPRVELGPAPSSGPEPSAAAPSAAPDPVDAVDPLDSRLSLPDLVELFGDESGGSSDPRYSAAEELLLAFDDDLLATVLAERCNPATLEPDEYPACLLDASGLVEDLIEAATDGG